MQQEGKVQYWFSRLQSSIGYIPTLLAIGAVFLSFILVWLDRLYVDQIRQHVPWLFGGSADAARGLLSTIASSLITVISIAFSITIIALQQAANNYSPRVLRTFTSDKGNQIVLGMYLATYIFSLLVLRTVRSEETNGGFVPAISIATAIILTLICLGLLIYFINKMFNSLQAVEIIKRIHREIDKEINTLYPESIGKSATETESAEEIFKQQKQSKQHLTITSVKAGFVNIINKELLEQINSSSIHWVYIPVAIGDFVNKQDVIATVDYSGKNNDFTKTIQNAIEIHDMRSMFKDPLFGFRQLADIALRAISPGVNDPTTAEYALRYMGDSLKQLAQRKFPENKRTFENNPVLFILASPSWEEYISLAFTQLRREAISEGRILLVLAEILSLIGKACDSKNRKEPIRKQLLLLEETVKASSLIASDKTYLLQSIKKAVQDL